MKSFCVYNRPLNQRLYEKIGASAVYAFGERIGVVSSTAEKSAAAATYLCNGIAAAGGTAEFFGNVNESRIPFLARNYSLSAAFCVDSDSLVSIYANGGRPLTALEEQKMAEYIARDDMPIGQEGVCLEINSDYAYKKALVIAAQSLEGASADVFCVDRSLRNMVYSVMNLSGADFSSKPRLFISRSGFGISARDESGKVHNREKLLDICCACRLKAGETQEVSFSASSALEAVAAAYGGEVKRSFDAGGELWKSDGVFLAVELLRNMSVYGTGLSTLSEILSDSFVVRRNIFCSLSADEVADLIPCNEIITDGTGHVYVRHDKGNILLTRSGNLKSYCVEVCASDGETAAELVSDIGAVLST